VLCSTFFTIVLSCVGSAPCVCEFDFQHVFGCFLVLFAGLMQSMLDTNQTSRPFLAHRALCDRSARTHRFFVLDRISIKIVELSHACDVVDVLILKGLKETTFPRYDVSKSLVLLRGAIEAPCRRGALKQKLTVYRLRQQVAL